MKRKEKDSDEKVMERKVSIRAVEPVLVKEM